jgi:DNA-binding transcriptional LysR family regulator
MSREIVEEKLLAKQIHIGVMSLPSKHKELECWPLFEDNLVLIVGTTHPWVTREIISATELRDADWILREGSAATRQLITATLAEHGLPMEELRVSMVLGSVEAVEEAVEAGHGVSFVSRLAVRRALEMGRISIVPVEGLDVRRQILLARNKTRTCTCSQLRFREFIESAEGQQLITKICG